MKFSFTILLLFFSFNTLFGQTYKNQVKGNVLLAPLGITNLAYERALGKHLSVQAEGFISPWKSFAHNHMQIYMANVQLRYYFHQTFSKFYIGADLGYTEYDLQKWNYINTDRYQRGLAYLTGAVAGYVVKINDHWNMEVFLKGGNSQGKYHGYLKSVNPPERYESHVGYWNGSGEWLPYGGGVMLTYGF